METLSTKFGFFFLRDDVITGDHTVLMIPKLLASAFKCSEMTIEKMIDLLSDIQMLIVFLIDQLKNKTLETVCCNKNIYQLKS